MNGGSRFTDTAFLVGDRYDLGHGGGRGKFLLERRRVGRRDVSRGYESSLFEDLRSCKNDLKLKLDKIKLTKLTFCQN